MADDICAVKIPLFNASDPTLWFGMCEATFELAVPKPITESKTKFNYVVAHLPPDIASTVRDIILDPDKLDPYGVLKNNVVNRCSESSTQSIRKLLAGEQLGDRKPTELLRIMKSRAESQNVSDSMLLELFLNQLPVNVQSIIASILPTTSQKAAEVADRILEVTPTSFEVSTDNSVSQINSANNLDINTQSRLLEEIRELRKEVNSLRRSRSISRNRNQNRFRRRTPSSDGDRLCWYHRKFASKAKKCVPPCSFSKNAEGQV